MFSERTVEWLTEMKRPSRSGTHSNTAFALTMMLGASRTTGDRVLESAILDAAERLYGRDRSCPTAYEPWAADFLSPCLEEAALMAEVLGEDWVPWLGGFLPPLESEEFEPLTRPTDAAAVVAGSEDPPTEEDEVRVLAASSHLIGLAFIRADAMNRIAAALPPGDERAEPLRRVARLHGARGFEAMFDADYAGSHWIGTFALKYLLTEAAPS